MDRDEQECRADVDRLTLMDIRDAVVEIAQTLRELVPTPLEVSTLEELNKSK